MSYNKSVSHQRSIKGYLRPKSHTIFFGMCEAEKLSMSKAINIIVSEYANKLNDEKRTSYINAFHSAKVSHNTKTTSKRKN